MLRRQRTILKLLTAAAPGISPTQLQKFVFLMREETFLRQDAAFYDFLPYKYGPYSFAAQHEIEALTNCGYIELSGTSLSATPLGTIEANRVHSDTVRATGVILSKYGGKPLKDLLKDVYARYPWYAVKSELAELAPPDTPKPQTAPVAVYTIGYEDSSVDGFLNTLVRAGILRTIDVRANPVSRKYGFAGRVLAILAAKLGLAYVHCPELGISSERRRTVHTASEFRDLFCYYERHAKHPEHERRL